MMRRLCLFVVFYLVLLMKSLSAHAAESHWPLGMVVGAGVGAVGGVAIGYGVAPLCEENESECRRQLPLIGAGVGLVVGGLTGGIIGSFFERNDFGVHPTPLINRDGEWIAGFSLSGYF